MWVDKSSWRQIMEMFVYRVSVGMRGN